MVKQGAMWDAGPSFSQIEMSKSVASARSAAQVVGLFFALWSNCQAGRVEMYNLTAHITQDSEGTVQVSIPSKIRRKQWGRAWRCDCRAELGNMKNVPSLAQLYESYSVLFSSTFCVITYAQEQRHKNKCLTLCTKCDTPIHCNSNYPITTKCIRSCKSG